MMMMMMAMEKKRKRNEEEEEGVFSKLPDDVIIHILSFLDTPSAARSSILCKRFTPLWHSLRSITLPHISNFNSMAHLIRTISKQSHGTTFRKLCLSFHCPSVYRYEYSSFRKLIRRAFNKCSGELQLSFPKECYYTPPLDPLLSSAAPITLTSIQLTYCSIKTLHHLLSSCPLLHHLSLHLCSLKTPAIRISSTRLRALELDQCKFKGVVESQIHIEAKNLETFSYSNGRKRAGEKDLIVFTEFPESLKSLSLNGYTDRRWIEATIPKFLALESLSVYEYLRVDFMPPPHAMEISSQSLKSFKLISPWNFTIDSPMLTRLSLAITTTTSSAQGFMPPTHATKISFQSLKSLELTSPWNFTIDSPVLTSLRLNGCSAHGFRSITSLVLHDVPQFPDFKLLELLRELKLIACQTIHVSHNKLERLDIRHCRGTEEAHIDTPCLRSFTHRGDRGLRFRCFNHSTSLEVAVTCLKRTTSRSFLETFKSCKVLTITAPKIEGSRMRYPCEPFQGEVLVLRIGPRASYKALIESVLRMCCHVKLIKISLDNDLKSIQFKYNEAALKGCPRVCLKSRSIIRCWTHCLERVMLTNISREQLNLQQFVKNHKMLGVNIQIN